MVVINKIEEPTCELYHNDILVGKITSSLQLNDCILQIFRGKLEGYNVKYEEIHYPIQPNGRIKNGGVIYPLYSQQMKEIMGF